MSWEDVACLILIVIGVILFLYGSNYYDAIVGWSGVSLTIGALLVLAIVKLYKRLKK
jgi:drug/metabolite transporter (DMT)-like permease